MSYDQEKNDPAKVVSDLNNLWEENNAQIQQMIDNRSSGCLPYLIYFWWAMWHGFPKNK